MFDPASCLASQNGPAGAATTLVSTLAESPYSFAVARSAKPSRLKSPPTTSGPAARRIGHRRRKPAAIVRRGNVDAQAVCGAIRGDEIEPAVLVEIDGLDSARRGASQRRRSSQTRCPFRNNTRLFAAVDTPAMSIRPSLLKSPVVSTFSPDGVATSDRWNVMMSI